MVTHANHKIRYQTNARVPLPFQVISPRNHLDHATSARKAYGIAVRIKSVQAEEGIDLFEERDAIALAKALVIYVLNDAEMLGNVNDVRRDDDAFLAQAPRREIDH